MADEPKTPRQKRTRKDGQPDRRGNPGGVPTIPRHVPTDANRRVVMASVAAGIEQPAIAVALHVSTDTLQRHYRAELDHGKEAANAKVAGVMFQMASDPEHKDCHRAGQFWLQAQAGWRTREERQHTFGGLGGMEVDAAPDEDKVKPVAITFKFVSDRPKGLPGAKPEDRDPPA